MRGLHTAVTHVLQPRTWTCLSSRRSSLPRRDRQTSHSAAVWPCTRQGCVELGLGVAGAQGRSIPSWEGERREKSLVPRQVPSPAVRTGRGRAHGAFEPAAAEGGAGWFQELTRTVWGSQVRVGRRPGQATLPREGRFARRVPWVSRRGTEGQLVRAVAVHTSCRCHLELSGLLRFRRKSTESWQLGFCAPCRPFIGRRRRVHGPLHSAVSDRDGPRVGVLIPSPEDLPPPASLPMGNRPGRRWSRAEPVARVRAGWVRREGAGDGVCGAHGLPGCRPRALQTCVAACGAQALP